MRKEVRPFFPENKDIPNKNFVNIYPVDNWADSEKKIFFGGVKCISDPNMKKQMLILLA